MPLKLKPTLPRVDRPRPPLTPQESFSRRPVSDPLLVAADGGRDRLGLLFRGAFLLLLIQQSWLFMTESNLVRLGNTSFALHNIHLVFHEAGHMLLMWAPRMLMVLGGTLGQLLMPLALVISFAFRQKNVFAAAVCLWWLGHSVVDCAPYINDARAMQLQLLGGGTGNDQEGHDWNYILGTLDALPYDIHIARAVLLAGRTIMMAALIWAFCWIGWAWFRHHPARTRNSE